MTTTIDKNLLADEEWRLNNLYYIKNEQGQKVRFVMKPEQRQLYRGMWYLNIILKARQLGMTTFIQIFMLDRCLFNSDTSAGVIAQTLEDAIAFFDDKLKYAWDNLPEDLREQIGEEKTNNSRELKFGNGSKIRVGTSMRSGTLQYLHISEFGKICAEAPKKATEIVSGALNTVAPGQFIFIESTAQGRQGRFYEMSQTAEEISKSPDIQLTPMDYKFFFFPWYVDPKYQMPGPAVPLTDTLKDYFAELEREEGVTLSIPQRNWYAKKDAEQAEDMKQEYPATPAEAFERMLKGAIFAQQLRAVRKENRVTSLPHLRGRPVNVFWDLGHNDTNSMWFHQKDGAWDNFIRYYEHRLVDITHYMHVMDDMEREHGYQWGTMYLPHDGASRHIESVAGSVSEILRANGYKVRVVERTRDKTVSIEAARTSFSHCRFDRVGCDDGIKCLEGYTWTWDEKGETYRKTPAHNYASNGSDAFQTYATGYHGEDGSFRQQLARIDGSSERQYRRGRVRRNPLTNPDTSHVI